MHYIDDVFGQIEINEPVILELINCPTLQRLKDIDQAGYLEPFLPNTSYSRYKHSLGVYILLNKYKAPLEEQIAGLIHDVSHSAFSHCVDYVLSANSAHLQDHQDNIFENFIKKSEIPTILNKYNYQLDYILNDNNFPLKEKNLPDLCADRIDYSLRTIAARGETNKIKPLLASLIVKDNYWLFKDFSGAKDFADMFFIFNKDYCCGLPSALMFRTTSDYLDHALKKGYITEDDLYTTDKQVLNKINQYLTTDSQLQIYYERMNNKIKYSNNPIDFDYKITLKSRVIDPLYLNNGQIKRLSDSNPTWLKVLEQESKPKEYFLKFEQ